MEKATFGAGCFWGVEATFRQLNGVTDTRVGYMGGTTENPTYQDVCSGTTNHAEVVEVTFDETIVDYRSLVNLFWQCHDPTTLNRQGPDVGTQYRSAIFYHNNDQQRTARESLAEMEASRQLTNPIVTEITPVSTFYLAEDYHQQYLEKRGLTKCRI